MKIYISGISGTGMGPLALMAHGAGLKVFGSDLAAGAVTNELVQNGISLTLGSQDGGFLRSCVEKDGVTWFVHTAALPPNHPELKMAKKLGLKISKRDELISYLVKKLKLKMIAVAGTHGKTTTTAMIVWGAQQLGIPVSYIIGTTLPFAEAGKYDPDSEYFVYEADEFDRNFLHFHPWLAVITTVSYDHPDIYPSVEDYQAAFLQFEEQSEEVLHGDEIAAGLNLAGEARRYDATLALDALERIMPQKGLTKVLQNKHKQIIDVLNCFPGVGRRFEQVSEGYYSDYAHHPEEVKVTVEIAIEEAERRGLKGVVAIYEPHQNTRQAELVDRYRDAFVGVEQVYWVPTYLTREPKDQKILKPADYINLLDNKKRAESAELDDNLAEKIRKWHDKGYLILLMSAGPADAWIRRLVYAPNQESAATPIVTPLRSAEEGMGER